MKGAVIDLGTNTFSLSVFERKEGGKEVTVLESERNFVNLGDGGINEHTITPKAMKRAFEVIQGFALTCQKHQINPDFIKAFATSAIREAENGKVFVARVKNELGITIKLIDGIEEARLVFAAVKGIHDFKGRNSCIMDIGGGSTEFSWVQNNELGERGTFDIGLSRLVQLFPISDPLTEEDLAKISEFLEQNLGGFLQKSVAECLVGVGGSFESYYHILTSDFDYSYGQSYYLPIDKLFPILDELIYSSREERINNPKIIDFRVDMINIAAYKTKWVLQKLQAKACFFSPASLKEGIIATEF